MSITLKAARVNKGLNQTEAAEILGVSKDKLARWESGKSFPDVPAIKRIEDAYDVPYNEIDFLVKSAV